MKKIILSVLIICAALLCSCGGTPEMSGLLKYQEENFRAEINVGDGTEFEAEIEKSDGKYTVTIKSPSETAGISYVFEGGHMYLCYEEMKIPVSAGAPFSVEGWMSCFMLDAGGVWKITEESPGGANVYKCSGDGVTVYIDRATHYPYRIEKGTVTIDIPLFKVIK